MGRPTKYTKAIADEVINRLSEGESLSSICRSDHIPSKGTVIGWSVDDRESFSDRYAKACLIRAHVWADEIITISDDDDDVARSRLKVDSRKWLVSKLIPKFSDKEASTVIIAKAVDSITYIEEDGRKAKPATD